MVFLMMRKYLSHWKFASVILFVFIGIFLLSFHSVHFIKNTNVYFEKRSSSYTQNFEKKQQEIVLIYLGSSVCKYAIQLANYDLDQAKSWLFELAISQDMSFTSVGISVNWGIHNGLKHLLTVGNFDEVIIGNNWFNHGVIKYIGELDQETFTPQIFIMVKDFDSADINRKSVNESLLLVLKGKNEIADWIAKPYLNINQFKR